LGGLHVRGLDQTGLSQKAGPVVSDLRLSADGPQPSNKASAGTVDVLLAFDQLVGGNDATLRTLSSERTVVIANSAQTATGSMVVHPERPYPIAELADRFEHAVHAQVRVDAHDLVVRLLGDDSAVNVFMLGVAIQGGHVPVGPSLIERAITLNGVAVQKNLTAFAWGRAWAHDAETVIAAAGVPQSTEATPLRELLTADLVGYQSARYAARFTAVVDEVAALGDDPLTEAVMRNLHRLMAYKDEYEVARLMLLPSARAQARAVGGRRTRVTWLLHPPALRALGVRRKVHFGAGSTPVFWALRGLRRVRGTPLDLFGWAHVRRVERSLVTEYVAAVGCLLAELRTAPPSAARLTEARAIAALPDTVRGYEQLKLERAAAYREELSRRLHTFTSEHAASLE